ncbi:MAG: hypothetical protein ACMXX8_00010 [Candidatus Woesearchaeota archaeon]
MYKRKSNELDLYVVEHLKDYIKYHIENGYSKKSINNALLKFGYTPKMIDNLIKNTKYVHKNIEKKYTENDLKGETYYYLRSMLVDYISKQIEHGFKINDIRNALIKYGHHRDIVDDAVQIIKGKTNIDIRFKINKKIMFWLNIIIILLFMIIMSLLLDVHFFYTFVIFTPSLFAFILSKVALDFFKKIEKYLPLSSVILTIILFFSIFPALNKTDADSEVILALNAVIAFILTYFYTISNDNRESKTNGNKS